MDIDFQACKGLRARWVQLPWVPESAESPTPGVKSIGRGQMVGGGLGGGLGGGWTGGKGGHPTGGE